MTKILRWMLLCLISVLSLEQVATADPPEPETEWGDFTGQLIYDGEPPKLKQLKVKAGYPETLDESLVVHPKSRGLMNVFVYLRRGSSDGPMRVHPKNEQKVKKPVQWNVDKWGFTPHAMLMHTDQPLIFSNLLPTAVNFKSDPFSNGASSMLLPPTTKDTRQYSKTERLPTPVGSNIQYWFSGYLLILDHPYAAITDKDGKFSIKNLPVGEHEFQVWQEKSGYLPLPAVKLRDTELDGDHKKGRLRLGIQSGENDLGNIKIDPKVFE